MLAKVIITTLFALSCLNVSAQSIDALGIEGSKFVPVFIGGWGSCDSLRSETEKKEFGRNTPHQMFLYQQAINYIQNVNSHAETGIKKFILVCANKWSLSGAFAQGEIRLLSYNVHGKQISMASRTPEIVNIDTDQDNTMGVLMRALPSKDTRSHLSTRILEVANGLPLVLFGHSYGGWIGKRIIEILAAPDVYQSSSKKRDRKLFADTTRLLQAYSSFPIHTFFSLEGISAVRCRIEKSIFAGIESMLDENATNKSMGCREETQSFQDELRIEQKAYPIRSLPLEQTASQVKNWFNIMLQESNLPTRAQSSTTPGILNITIDVMPYGSSKDYDQSQKHPFKNAHHMLGFSSEAWNTICDLTLGDATLCHAKTNLNNKGR